ncbi:putative reverse transcriptase domain-containing protein [Tanacetum coccineum]|uniref:Reverse transcriptase domain-containing protein n=1 Tax=Tanacetum coccineum TaxID=301880 RepID=A0ABQ5HDG7_9ASTR
MGKVTNTLHQIGIRAKVKKNQGSITRSGPDNRYVMVISVISVSSDSLKESVGTSAGRVILFSIIPTTISDTTPTVTSPTTHVDTTLTPTEIPTPDPSEDPSSDRIPPLPATSPFLSSTDDSSDSDTLDTRPSSTHEVSPIEVAPPTGQILPAPFGVHRRRVTIISPGQPIPYGRSYHCHPNGPVHMMTTRNRVGPLPTHRLAVIHSVDYSSSDYFTSDDSSRDSPSDSSSETSSDSSLNALSDSSSGHSSSDHSSLALPSGMISGHQLCSSVSSIPHSSAAITERPSHSSFMSPSRKRSMSLTTSLPVSSPVPGQLSSIRADLLPPCKRIRSSDSVTDLEDFGMRDMFESYGCTRRLGEVETSARGTVEVRDDIVMHPMVLDDIPKPAQEEGAIEVTYEMLGDLVQRFHDHTVEIPVHQVQVIKSIQRDQGHKIVATGYQSVVSRRGSVSLEWDNTNLGGMLDDTSQRVNPIYKRRSCMFKEREMRQIQRLRFYDRIRIGRLEAKKGGMNREAKMVMIMKDGNGEVMEVGFMPVARECTYQDFLKCQPLNFKGTEGVVGLTRWFEKMEMVFHISNCPQKNQVKYATCTLLDRNVIVVEPTRLQDAIRIANNLMDQKLKGYARSAENKRRVDNMLEVRMWQDLTRQETMRKRGMLDLSPTTTSASCTMKDCVLRPIHYRKDCPKLRNQNQGNKTGNKIGNKTGNNKATTKAYAIRGGGANPDSNVVTCTFLLNNCYASMLLDSGADRSFVSSTFSALLDVAPSTLDTSYSVKLAYGRILETNVILRGCTLGLLGHSFDIDLILVEISSFDVIISMNWLAKYHAVIVCDEKIIRVPYGDEVLITRGDDCDS